MNKRTAIFACSAGSRSINVRRIPASRPRRRSVRDFFGDLFSNPAYHAVDLAPEQVFLADELRFTRDPFDALIVATARSLDLPLLTRDGDVRASGTVRVIW